MESHSGSESQLEFQIFNMRASCIALNSISTDSPHIPQEVVNLYRLPPRWETSSNPHRTQSAIERRVPRGAQEQNHNLKTRCHSRIADFRRQSKLDILREVCANPMFASQDGAGSKML